DLKNLRRELEARQGQGSTPSLSGQYGDTRGSLSIETEPDHAPASAAAVPVPPSPKDLAQSDVVFAHANLDDQPLMSGRPGWISQLHQNLQVRVAQLSGKQVAVVKHSDRATSTETEAEVLKQIPNAKTVVSVLSPPFAHSNGCLRVVESFWKSA